MKNILVIAGSDPSGGAGIELAIRIYQKLGIYTFNAITAITAQNSKGVQDFIFVDKDIFKKQLNSISDDFKIDLIKIGIIGDKSLIDTFLKWYKELNIKIPIVIDTVLKSTADKSLISNDNLWNSYKELLSISTIITPNLKEAQILSGKKEINDIIKYFREIGIKNGVITGGDISLDVAEDIIFSTNDIRMISTSKIKLDNEIHGTGCFFSNILGYYYLENGDIFLSSQKAKDMITNYIKNKTQKIGSGYYYFIV